MSEFDKLTLEVISRSSIPEEERLGLAELQLQRAQRMNNLMVGKAEADSDVIAKMTDARDLTLDAVMAGVVQKKQDQLEARLEKEADDEPVDLEAADRPSQADVHGRTPTAATPGGEKPPNPPSASPLS